MRPSLYPPTIQERFAAFDLAHPEVYAAFLEIAEQLLANDHFVSRYARKLMAEDARFSGFFTTRTLHG